MWSLTVKTLDGSNHKFEEINPDNTVRELKEQISERVGIPADRQRLIFCGRVLSDEKKVSEYQVEGRVVHLVARAPPGQGGQDGPDRVAESEARARSRGASPAGGRHRHTAHFHVHGGERVGAIGQSSPQVRLNLARDMIRQANAAMDLMEGGERQAGSPQQEQPSAEPASNGSSIDDALPGGATGPGGAPAPGAATGPGGAAGLTGFTTGPIQFMGPSGMTGEATATIHVQTESQGPPPPGLAEAISAMVQQYHGSGAEGGHISLRVENGRVVRENQEAGSSAAGPTSTSAATGTSASGAPATGAAGSPGSSIRHPPPSVLAEVLELFNTAQARLAAHAPRLTTLLREDPALLPDIAATQQTFFNSYSTCQHFLAHAQHAMSDIMLQLARPPPRQVRARPFVIQSVVQSAVLQSVPILTTMAPSPGAPANGPSPTRTASTGPSAPPAPELASHMAAVNAAQPGHLAAHQAAVAAHQAAAAAQHAAAAGGAQQSVGGVNVQIQQPQGSLQQMISSAMQGAGGGALQPVLVGIELGPDGVAGAGGAQGIQGVINSAIQQALRASTAPPAGPVGSTQEGSPAPEQGSTAASAPPSSTTQTTPSSGASSGPQVQVTMGPPIHIPMGPGGPMGPPAPPMGNLHAFDPFLPCSSHHVANGRAGARTNVRATQRDVRSAPGSRSSSLPRSMNLGTASAGTTPPGVPPNFAFDMMRNIGAAAGPQVQGPPPGLEGLLAGMLGQGQPLQSNGENQEQDNMMAMIQGVMGQVVGVLGGRGGNNPPTTIAQFLNTLPDYSYVAGDSLVTDLLMTLAQHLTFQDMVAIVGQNPSPQTLEGLQPPLRQFLSERLLHGSEPSRPAVEAALLAIADDWYCQMEEVAGLANVREDVHFPETLHGFLAQRPVELCMLILEADRDTFTGRLGETLRRLVAEATALCNHCFTDGQASLERVVENRLNSLTEDVGPMIRQAARAERLASRRPTQPTAPEPAEMDVDDERPNQNQAPATIVQTQPAGLPQSDNSRTQQERVRRRLPVVPPEVEPTFPTSLLAIPVTGPTPPGSGLADHALAVLPPSWAPIIARDTAEGGRAVQQPYSEAYLSGQPNKRRKLNTEKKPRGEVSNIISRSLQDAIEQTGLEPRSGEVVANVAAEVGAAPSLNDAVERYTRQALQVTTR